MTKTMSRKMKVTYISPLKPEGIRAMRTPDMVGVGFPPQVGCQFLITNPHPVDHLQSGIRVFTTTIVTKTVSETKTTIVFETLNSKYRIEFVDLEENSSEK